ncbi:HAD family hydrolase [Actinomycetospora sp. C-140]
MTVLAATDLDRTLVHSDQTAGPVVAHEVIRLERRRGVTTASLTRRTAASLVALERVATWVPATTRSVDGYRRLDLASALGVAPRYAVCANGAVLLVDGVPDAAWGARMRALIARAAPRREVARLLTGHLGALPHGKVRSADGALLVVRTPDVPDGWVAELDALLADRGWRVSAHDEKVHVLPAGLEKSAAVAEVGRRVAASRVLAAGDSPLDADLLLAADAGIQPVDGRLHAAGWHADHVAVTTGTGLRAGEEIAAWLLAQAVAFRPGASSAGDR